MLFPELRSSVPGGRVAWKSGQARKGAALTMLLGAPGVAEWSKGSNLFWWCSLSIPRCSHTFYYVIFLYYAWC